MKPTTNTHLLFEAPALKKALSFVGGAIIPKPIVPALENVKIEIANGKATLTGSDMYTTLTAVIDVNTPDAVCLLVPYDLLSSLLATMGNEPIAITVDTETFRHTLKSKAGKYTMPGENPIDYPNPNVSDESIFALPFEGDDVNALLTGLESTVYAVSGDELKPALGGVSLKLANEVLKFAATNGHVLAMYEMAVSAEFSQTQLVIPAKFTRLLIRLLSMNTSPETVQLSLTETTIIATVGDNSLSGRLIDDRFPAYENAVPINQPIRLLVSKSDIHGSLKRLMLVADKTTQIVKLTMRDNLLTLSAWDSGFGHDGDETISCNYDMELFSIGFNGRYLLEVLSHIEGETMEMTFSEANKAGLIRGTDENALMLVMPSLINDVYL